MTQTYPFEQLVGQLLTSETVQQTLAELLQSREGPVGSQLGSVEHFRLVTVHQNVKVRW